MEFLVHLHTVIPQDAPKRVVDDTISREGVRAAELAEQGHILRMWRPPLQPGERRALGLWRADNEEQLRGLVATLPLSVWFSVEVTPLSPHPNDPQADA
jgi:muconolactone D-isomerase